MVQKGLIYIRDNIVAKVITGVTVGVVTPLVILWVTTGGFGSESSDPTPAVTQEPGLVSDIASTAATATPALQSASLPPATSVSSPALGPVAGTWTSQVVKLEDTCAGFSSFPDNLTLVTQIGDTNGDGRLSNGEAVGVYAESASQGLLFYTFQGSSVFTQPYILLQFFDPAAGDYGTLYIEFLSDDFAWASITFPGAGCGAYYEEQRPQGFRPFVD